MWRVDTEVDGDRGDAFVLPRQSVRLFCNLLPHFVKVSISFALLVQELRPL